MEVPELGKSAANQRAAEEAEEDTVLEAESAFLIVKNKEGLYMMSLDINVPINVERQATLPEVKAALHVVLDDLITQETAALAAQGVVMHQMQMAAKLADARANQQILGNLPAGLAG